WIRNAGRGWDSVMGVVRRRKTPGGSRRTSGDILTEMGDPYHAGARPILIALGIVFLAAGVLWPLVSRYFGRLSGDLVVRRPGLTFAFPLVTCLILSLLLSLLLWLFRR